MKDNSHYYSRLDLWDGADLMETRDEQRARTAALMKEPRRRGKQAASRRRARNEAWLLAAWVVVVGLGAAAVFLAVWFYRIVTGQA
jgi:hypothetical protein